MLCDYHVHSSYSDDSRCPMEEDILAAADRGLEEIALTDHVDYGVKLDWGEEPSGGIVNRNVNYPLWNRELESLRKKYQGRIRVKKGMEFGIQRHTVKDFAKLFGRYDFDFILLSVHQIDDQEFWTQDYQRGKTQREVYRGYYMEILQVMDLYHDYSSLAHLDLLNRYERGSLPPFEMTEDLVREILKKAVREGKALEFNTAYRRYHLADIEPSARVWKIYKELGGRLITIGSDSHQKETVGEGVREAHRQLRELGFAEFCTYDHMVPFLHPLEE